MTLNRRQCLLGAATSALTGPIASWADQLKQPASERAAVDEVWTDSTRQRDIPVRIRWPALDTAVPAAGWPVVIFSHGLGGTVAGGQTWGEAWCTAGMVVLHLQHPGSDLNAVRQQARNFSDQAGLRRAAGPQQLVARLEDVVFALDEIARRHASGQGRWAQVRPQGVGMSGHSFGAHTTLGVAGQRYPGHPGIQELRLAAFVAFSPTLPARGDSQHAFERMSRPMLCLTGTRDDDVVGVGATPERRAGVFDALPPGQKAQLVLKDADHMTFAGQTGAAVEIIPRHGTSRSLQAQHHALVAEITTDWWRAHLMGDEAAKQRLVQPSRLASGDRWLVG